MLIGVSYIGLAQTGEVEEYEAVEEGKNFQAKGETSMQVVISENMQLMSLGSNNALTMAIPGADQKKVEMVWKEFAKDFKAKTRKDRKSGLYFTDNATMRGISDNDVDVYAKFERGGTGTVATMWFDLGGAYLASETHDAAYEEAEELLRDFANAVGRSMAEDNVEEQEKILKGLEKDLNRLEKDKENYLKKIEDAKNLILEMEANIEQNKKDQENKVGEIGAQEKVIDRAKAKVRDFN